MKHKMKMYKDDKIYTNNTSLIVLHKNVKRYKIHTNNPSLNCTA